MSALLWILLFAVVTALCVWIVLGGGADSVAALFLAFAAGADSDSSDVAVRILFGIGWVCAAGWFVMGLIDPAVRL